MICRPRTSLCYVSWLNCYNLSPYIQDQWYLLIFLKKCPQQKAQILPLLWALDGTCAPLCRRIEAMFRALWRHQGVSTELGDQGTPFKELCVGIVDACMLSPTVGPWMAPGFHTKTWCHDVGCGPYWACAVRREARLDLRSRAPTGR